MTDNGAWTYGDKLTSGDTDAGSFGSSVSLSSDGTKALVGAPADAGVGAAWAFTITVDNTDPSYPTSTATQDHKFTGGNQSGGLYGAAVALSGDGTTALIGGTRDFTGVSNTGSVWAYKLVSGTWTQQGSKFTGTGGTAAFLFFGDSIALSQDGNTAVVGGRADGNGPGLGVGLHPLRLDLDADGREADRERRIRKRALRLERRSLGRRDHRPDRRPQRQREHRCGVGLRTRHGTSWSQQGSKLVGDDENDASQFGTSVALSADGNTALVGGPKDESDTGAAWLYVRSGGTWAEQGTKQSGSGFGTSADGTGTQTVGTSVSLSDDGLTSALGSPTDSDEPARCLASRSPLRPPRPVSSLTRSTAAPRCKSRAMSPRSPPTPSRPRRAGQR